MPLKPRTLEGYNFIEMMDLGNKWTCQKEKRRRRRGRTVLMGLANYWGKEKEFSWTWIIRSLDGQEVGFNITFII